MVKDDADKLLVAPVVPVDAMPTSVFPLWMALGATGRFLLLKSQRARAGRSNAPHFSTARSRWTTPLRGACAVAPLERAVCILRRATQHDPLLEAVSGQRLGFRPWSCIFSNCRAGTGRVQVNPLGQ